MIKASFLAALCLVAAPLHAQETEIYSALLHRLARMVPASAPLSVEVARETVALAEYYRPVGMPPSEEDIAWRVPEASKAVIADLLRKSAQAAPVDFEPPPANAGLTLRTSGDGRDVLRFSRIGLDPTSAQALVLMSRSCPGLCGWAELVLLKRENGAWKAIKTATLWIS
jgi:hypothetical protein